MAALTPPHVCAKRTALTQSCFNCFLPFKVSDLTRRCSTKMGCDSGLWHRWITCGIDAQQRLVQMQDCGAHAPIAETAFAPAERASRTEVWASVASLAEYPWSCRVTRTFKGASTGLVLLPLKCCLAGIRAGSRGSFGLPAVAPVASSVAASRQGAAVPATAGPPCTEE